MKKVLFSSLFLVIMLMGCNEETYNNAIQKGLDHIGSEEYQKAESAFELALEEKKEDVKATALLAQTRYYQEALEDMEEAELEAAAEKAEKVTKETEGSEALIKKAEELVSSIEILQTTLAEITEEYESAMYQFEEEEYEDANKIIEDVLNKDLSHPLFQPVKKEMEELQHDIEAAVIAKEKEEKEKAEQAAAKKAQEQKEQSTKVNLTADEALTIIKNLNDWPSTTTFDLEPNLIEWGEESYYGIYVDTHVDESNSSTSILRVDAKDGSVYDFSRGEMIPVN
ncbi:hypothetical protein [Ornithinibacillus sp. FSL M8-0202]|uniref:hypothetical protein n=1 Tax=Ornithinibacillus sp. FSL M8-0202 TaxID=2921616 RepID=UPI0030D42F3E